MTGPPQASVGVTATYRIDATNSGGQPANGVVVSDPLPDGLTYLQSNPAAERGVAAAANAAAALQWTLGTLQPGETRTIQLDVRPDRAGPINHCASVRTADGLTGQDCATTTVRAAAVEVHLTGPDNATVGQTVRFLLEVVDHGDSPAAGLRLRDRYDDGLTHVIGKNPIEVELDPPVPAGQSFKTGITFTVAKPGHLCHTVELLTAAGVVLQSTQACLDATAAAATTPAVSVKITGPASAQVGKSALFTIVVANTGHSGELRTCKSRTALILSSLRQRRPATGTSRSRLASLGQSPISIQARPPRDKSSLLAAWPARNYVQASVTDASGAAIGNDQACMEVTMPEAASGGKLNVTVAATSNPIKVGADTKFIITLSNTGQNPERNVALAVTVPDQLQYVEGPCRTPPRRMPKARRSASIRCCSSIPTSRSGLKSALKPLAPAMPIFTSKPRARLRRNPSAATRRSPSCRSSAVPLLENCRHRGIDAASELNRQVSSSAGVSCSSHCLTAAVRHFDNNRTNCGVRQAVARHRWRYGAAGFDSEPLASRMCLRI